MPSSARAQRVGAQHELLEELVDDELHLDRRDVRARLEVVVERDREHRDADAAGGRDERLGDTFGDDGEATGAGLRDVVERADDADDGAEQTDERRDRTDGADRPEAPLHPQPEALALTLGGALHRLTGVAHLVQRRDEDVGDRGRAALTHRPRSLQITAVERLADLGAEISRALDEVPVRVQLLEREREEDDRTGEDRAEGDRSDVEDFGELRHLGVPGAAASGGVNP